MKKVLHTEMAYVLGLLILALGTAFMERADFGMSMVVAPAYLIHLKLSETLSWFTFGVSEYCFQAVLIILICLFMRQFKRRYLFSFVIAFIYGNVLDLVMKLVSFVPGSGIAVRGAFFVGGMLLCAVGVSLLFHTYIAPEAYELFVKEYAGKYGMDINKVKTVYDCCSCLIAIVMSFVFMGMWHFEGVKLGTIICALVNGYIIGMCSRVFEKHFEFRDAFKLRTYFE